jgi:hypothetical protein
MINVNQITSQLARMPDQALQKYAMLNKNDPYTVSLALSESNRRKAMREGAAPMPGQMPKVVDQDIAQMSPQPMQQMPPQQQMPQQARPQRPQQAQQQLPENTGIGQLPAPNMQRMADGGIVGYADTGLVETNKFVIPPQGIKDPQTGEIIKPESWNALPKSQQMRLVGALRSQAGLDPVPTNAYPGIQYAQYGPSIEQWQQGIKNANPTMAQEREQNMAVVNAQAPTIERGRPTMANDPRLLTSAAPIDTTRGAPTGGGVNTLVVPPKTGAGANVAGGPAAPAGGITALPSEADTIKRLKENMVQNTEKPLDESAFLKRMSDISQPAYDKANAMVEKEKGRLKEGKEQDFYMALIEGGLAAASESSPNGIQNIAKGFSKGAASYREGLKDFRKASQENAKMELELARAEAADKKGDVKTLYERMDKYEDRKLKRDDTINHGIAQIINTNTSGQFDIAKANIAGQYGLQQARINKEGSIAASMAPQNLITALGKSKPGDPLYTGYQMQTLKAHAASLQENWSRQAYPNGNMGEPNQAFLARYPTPQTYIQENMDAMSGAMGGTGGGFVQPPANATILPPKK